MPYFDNLGESDLKRLPGRDLPGGEDVPLFLPSKEALKVALSLAEAFSQDYRMYALTLIERYNKESSTKRRLHNVLQIIIFAGAAFITATVAIEGVPKLVPVLLGAAVALATALANFYKFGERSRALYLTAESMALEYNRFSTKRGLYKDLDEKTALHLFMDRMEDILHEDTQRRLALEQMTDRQRTNASREREK